MIDIGEYFSEHGGDISLFLFLKGEISETNVQLSELSDEQSVSSDRTEQRNNVGTRT